MSPLVSQEVGYLDEKYCQDPICENVFSSQTGMALCAIWDNEDSVRNVEHWLQDRRVQKSLQC